MRIARPLIAIALFRCSPRHIRRSQTRAECERDYKPQIGQAGKDVIWVPTPDELVNRMLTMAEVTPKDYVFDLGAGDGKIAIAPARSSAPPPCASSTNPDMAKLAAVLRAGRGVTDG